MNPGHDKHLKMVRNLASKKRYRLSKILKIITRNQNLGLNLDQFVGVEFSLFFVGVQVNWGWKRQAGKKEQKPKSGVSKPEIQLAWTE